MTFIINWLIQLVAVTRFTLVTLPQRAGSTAAAAFGICGVVTVLVGVLSIAQGFRQALVAAGSPSTAVVLRSGSDSEMMSILTGEETRMIADAPGIARGPSGPVVSAELFTVINLTNRATRTDTNVPLRGVQPAAMDVRDGVRLLAGRRFEPGRNEIMVGRAAAEQFEGLELGALLRVGRNDWAVVGVFEAQGGAAESEIWTDAPVLQAAYQRGNTYQSVCARLVSAGSFDEFKAHLMQDPRLSLKVVRQSDYYLEQSTTVSNLITGLGTIVSVLMGLGAVFGALNTMYSAVATRTREIATLRALGFGRTPVVFSILVESLMLALVGGLAGGLLAYGVFNGFKTSTMNWQSFSQVAFAFAVTPDLLVKGAIYAAVIGLFGGLPPALRAVRIPVAQGLREH